MVSYLVSCVLKIQKKLFSLVQSVENDGAFDQATKSTSRIINVAKWTPSTIKKTTFTPISTESVGNEQISRNFFKS